MLDPLRKGRRCRRGEDDGKAFFSFYFDCDRVARCSVDCRPRRGSSLFSFLIAILVLLVVVGAEITHQIQAVQSFDSDRVPSLMERWPLPVFYWRKYTIFFIPKMK